MDGATLNQGLWFVIYFIILCTASIGIMKIWNSTNSKLKRARAKFACFILKHWYPEEYAKLKELKKGRKTK